ncbi:hypothetical protein GQR58_015733 [Nymphon striatum]|nr:hypothetical protein GQR58_015733 [Nymphon striatum]
MIFCHVTGLSSLDEQVNELINGERGVVYLTESLRMLHKWMAVGTEIARLVTATKFATLVERHIKKRFGYLATTDLASEGRGSHFTKWRSGDIKMAIASTFVERFHRLCGLWMRLTEYYKRMGLNVQNLKFLGGGGGGGMWEKNWEKKNLDALTELACWLHAMDHMNYARWIPVHLKDMAELPERHPEVARKFREGSFMVQKTKKIFSSIAIDQAHEQNNACIKGDGGAVGLTDNPAALRRWMIAGPEVARVIEEFQHRNQHSGREDSIRHHDQTTSVQASFTIDVRSLVKVMEEFGNPFEEDSPDLVALDTKEIVGSPAIEAVRKVREKSSSRLSPGIALLKEPSQLLTQFTEISSKCSRLNQ